MVGALCVDGDGVVVAAGADYIGSNDIAPLVVVRWRGHAGGASGGYGSVSQTKTQAEREQETPCGQIKTLPHGENNEIAFLTRKELDEISIFGTTGITLKIPICRGEAVRCSAISWPVELTLTP